MAILQQLIAILDNYEKKDFLQYVQKQHAAKEYLLAKSLIEDPSRSSQELKNSVYGEGDKNFKRDAFNALRKQLFDRLLHWIVIARMADGDEKIGRIQGLLVVVHFILQRNAMNSACYLLSKAEELAEAERQYVTLETIYNYQIKNATSMGISVKEVIAKRKINRERSERYLELSDRLALQLENNMQAKEDGIILYPEISLKRALNQLNLKTEEANDPVFIHLIICLVRACIVTGKDYTSFERFVAKMYNRLSDHGCFRKGDADYEAEILFMYAHSCYRNRKFKLAVQLCERLVSLHGSKEIRTKAVYPKYLSLRAGIENLSGKNEQAIVFMEIALSEQVSKPEIQEWINMQLNLAVYYFQAEQYRKANKMMLAIRNTDVPLAKLMGREWSLKFDMIAFIVQYELGNIELARKMAIEVRSTHQELLKQSLYQRADAFMQLVMVLIDDPDSVRSQSFRDEVKSAQLAWPDHKEDIQAITFFCWLRSKMEKRPYYPVLLDRLRENRELSELIVE